MTDTPSIAGAWFPVLARSASIGRVEMRAWPRRIPWSLIEPWRARAEHNHAQSLEQLAQHGGLSPVELWLAAHDLEIGRFTDITEVDAARWLTQVIGELTTSELTR